MKRKMIVMCLVILASCFFIGQDFVVAQVNDCADCDGRFVNEKGDTIRKLKVKRNLTVNKDLNVGGTVNATAFVGDGSQLTVGGSSMPLPPVGAIIQYFGNNANLSPNWRVCDGSVVVDGASPLNGIALPDLRGRFPRGESDTGRDLPSQGPITSGNDDIAGHTHSLSFKSNHSHTLPGTTGSVSSSGTDPGAHGYRARDDNQGWTTGVHLRVDGGNSTQEGQHRHTLGSNTSGSGGHAHDVGSTSTNTGGNIPRYVGLHFIIRIK